MRILQRVFQRWAVNSGKGVAVDFLNVREWPDGFFGERCRCRSPPAPARPTNTSRSSNGRRNRLKIDWRDQPSLGKALHLHGIDEDSAARDSVHGLDLVGERVGEYAGHSGKGAAVEQMRIDPGRVFSFADI